MDPKIVVFRECYVYKRFSDYISEENEWILSSVSSNIYEARGHKKFE